MFSLYLCFDESLIDQKLQMKGNTDVSEQNLFYQVELIKVSYLWYYLPTVRAVETEILRKITF